MRAVVTGEPHARMLLRGGSAIRLNALRRAAADADDPRAIEAWLFRMRTDSYSREARREAARAVGRLGPAAASAVPALIATRRARDDDGVMREVVTALEQIGPAASDAVPMLEDLATP